MTSLPDKKSFYENLPKKRMAAAALFLDEQNRILIVKPTYKEAWEIPGGIVELDESPAACAVREVREETGLEISADVLKLLCLDYMHKGNGKTEALMFVFYAGVIKSGDIKKIALPAEELSAFEFLPPEEAVRKLPPVLGSRIERACRALEKGSAIYFDGFYS